jgi:hypothetical protein
MRSTPTDVATKGINNMSKVFGQGSELTRDVEIVASYAEEARIDVTIVMPPLKRTLNLAYSGRCKVALQFISHCPHVTFVSRI